MERRDFIGEMLALAGGTAFGDEYVAVKNRGGDCPRFPFGNPVPAPKLDKGVHDVRMPVSGLLKISYRK